MRRIFYSAMALGLIIAIGACSMLPGFGVVPTARVRVVHASPDAPAVDVCADGAGLFAGATFPGVTSYAAVPAGTYDIKVIPAGGGCANPGVIEAALPLAGGTDTTVAAINVLADIGPLVLADDNTAPAAGMARVRFVHASPDAPTVDITLPDGTTLFDDVSFGGNGGYIQVAAATYDLQVRNETGATTVLSVDDVTLEEGNVYTIFAVGLLSGTPALDAFVTVDRE